jgi:hypothetical protein
MGHIEEQEAQTISLRKDLEKLADPTVSNCVKHGSLLLCLRLTANKHSMEERTITGRE